MAQDPIVQSYEQDGYVIVRNAISAELAAEAAQHVAWLEKKAPTNAAELFSFHENLDAFWYRLIKDPGLLQIAEKFIGPDIALFASAYISKPPRSGRPVLWHQDGSYWPLDPMRVVSLWLAVDQSTPENGCMRVIPGTHRTELQALKESDTPNILGSGMDTKLVDETQAVDIELSPGDVSIHHPNVIHGSKANTSDQRRCGLTIRYIPTSTRITTPNWPTAFLLKGNAVEGVNTYVAPPTTKPDFEGFSVRRLLAKAWV